MQLGIDFGTTRTVVAYADRGNYPVVSFTDTNGDLQEYFPSVAAYRDGELVFGFEALKLEEDGAALLRSFKRIISGPNVTANTPVDFGDQGLIVGELLAGYTRALCNALGKESTIAPGFDPANSQVVVAVPAHAHSAQRFLTLDAFRNAGFQVQAMMNEPSAAGFEYTHRKNQTLNSKRTRVIVYDMGGGTFDASLVSVEGTSHDVIDSLGVNSLGGDDFDQVLAECATRQAGIQLEDLPVLERAALLNQCREVKEHLSPQSRRIPLEVCGLPVDIQVSDFYESAAFLVEQSMAAMQPLVGGLDDPTGLHDVAGIYLVGGAAGLPLVPRVLRERFGRRVHRSPYPSASTAIGLAIAADPNAGYCLHDRLSRGFGVFREGDAGHLLTFDPILSRDSHVSTYDTVSVERRYRAAHNVGWFRFVEYSGLSDQGEPVGDLMPFATIVFPFTSELQHSDDVLETIPVARTLEGHLIEERYLIDPHGIVEVTVTDLDTGYQKAHRWQ